MSDLTKNSRAGGSTPTTRPGLNAATGNPRPLAARPGTSTSRQGAASPAPVGEVAAPPGTAPSGPGGASSAPGGVPWQSTAPPGAATSGGDNTSADRAVSSGGRQWTLVFPAGLEILSANGREHRMVRYRKGRVLKDAAIVVTRAAKIPPLERITVTVLYDPPDRRRRDHDNLAPTAKHLLDGIVKAGVVPDDSTAYVDPPRCEVTGTPFPRGRLRMIITEAAS